LGLAALVVVIAFGPKRLPSFKSNKDANMIDLSSMIPSQPAAARAPSPLAQSAAPPAPASQPQYAMSGTAAPLQQPEPQSPQPLRLPDNL
jgi:hypothetical protein